jgi:hypothetical protein
VDARADVDLERPLLHPPPVPLQSGQAWRRPRPRPAFRTGSRADELPKIEDETDCCRPLPPQTGHVSGLVPGRRRSRRRSDTDRDRDPHVALHALAASASSISTSP